MEIKFGDNWAYLTKEEFDDLKNLLVFAIKEAAKKQGLLWSDGIPNAHASRMVGEKVLSILDRHRQAPPDTPCHG